MGNRRSISSAALAAIAAGALLTGCGGDDADSNADRFSGQQRDVAEVVDRLQDAAKRGDGTVICRRLFTPALARQVGRAQGCEKEVTEELAGPAAEFEVVDVRVRGGRAVAKVKDGDGDESLLSMLLAGDGSWRIFRIRSP